MSTHLRAFWVAVCDECGESISDRDDVEDCWGNSEADAIKIALEADWQEFEGRLLCPDCQLDLGDEDDRQEAAVPIAVAPGRRPVPEVDAWVKQHGGVVTTP